MNSRYKTSLFFAYMSAWTFVKQEKLVTLVVEGITILARVRKPTSTHEFGECVYIGLTFLGLKLGLRIPTDQTMLLYTNIPFTRFQKDFGKYKTIFVVFYCFFGKVLKNDPVFEVYCFFFLTISFYYLI